MTASTSVSARRRISGIIYARTRFHIVRSSSGASCRRLDIRLLNAAKSSVWAPSLAAWSGSGWTSISRPSAPAARAARPSPARSARLPVPWLGSTRIGRWESVFAGGMTRQVERVAAVVGERPHAALAEDHVVVAAGHDVLGGHQPLFERRAHAALQQHRLAALAHPLEQREVLHVPRADLDDVGRLLHGRGVFGVHQFGDDADAGLLAAPSRRIFSPSRPMPWKRTGWSAA